MLESQNLKWSDSWLLITKQNACLCVSEPKNVSLFLTLKIDNIDRVFPMCNVFWLEKGINKEKTNTLQFLKHRGKKFNFLSPNTFLHPTSTIPLPCEQSLVFPGCTILISEFPRRKKVFVETSADAQFWNVNLNISRRFFQLEASGTERVLRATTHTQTEAQSLPSPIWREILNAGTFLSYSLLP